MDMIDYITLLLNSNNLEKLEKSKLKLYLDNLLIKKEVGKQVCEKCRIDCGASGNKLICPICGAEYDLFYSHNLTNDIYKKFISLYFDIDSIKINQSLGRVFSFEKDSLQICCLFLLGNGIESVYKELLLENKENNHSIFVFYNEGIKSQISDLISKISKSDIIIAQKINEDLQFTKKNIPKFLNLIQNSIKLESKLLQDIKSNKREFKSLVSKIYSNPRYLINLTSNFLLNETYDTSSLKWQDYETIARVMFSILYDSDINVGGGSNKGDLYFCTRFQKTIEYGDPIVIGIGDTKFSRDPKLNTEKTEKYVNLFVNLRDKIANYGNYQVELMFFYLNNINNFEDLVNRIVPKLEKNESMLLFDISALVKISQEYLYSMVEISKYNQKITSLNIVKLVFLPEYLNKYFKTETKNNKNTYYHINSNNLNNFFGDLSNCKIKMNLIDQIKS